MKIVRRKAVSAEGVHIEAAETAQCSECEMPVSLREAHSSDVMILPEGELRGVVFCSADCESLFGEAWGVTRTK